ncbi:hypothetical protein DFH06DRAFT_1484544 [Mycena polygramma]|nr:hypothetical protein DFH06DRAFT_1484544 [Mycena polygramma]
MGDTIPNLKSSLLLSVLALIPGTIWRYACVALAFASLVLFITRHQGPTRQFNMLEDTIEVTEETLLRAKTMPTCASSHTEIIDAGYRLLRMKLSASRMQSRILEMRDETWISYLTNLGALLLDIRHCEAELKEIQTAMLLTIEEEHQRKLTEGIKKSREVLSAVATSKSPTASSVVKSSRDGPSIP